MNSGRWYKPFVLIAVVMVTMPASVATADDAPPRPNVVVILADDLVCGDVGCFNKECAFRVPHLDRMAEEGARLTAFCMTTPYCAPSRATLLTGRYRRAEQPGDHPAGDRDDRIAAETGRLQDGRDWQVAPGAGRPGRPRLER